MNHYLLHSKTRMNKVISSRIGSKDLTKTEFIYNSIKLKCFTDIYYLLLLIILISLNKILSVLIF